MYGYISFDGCIMYVRWIHLPCIHIMDLKRMIINWNNILSKEKEGNSSKQPWSGLYLVLGHVERMAQVQEKVQITRVKQELHRRKVILDYLIKKAYIWHIWGQGCEGEWESSSILELAYVERMSWWTLSFLFGFLLSVHVTPRQGTQKK